MRTTPDGRPADASCAACVRSVELPALLPNAWLPPAGEPLQGTVPAAMSDLDAYSYVPGSDAVIRGRPVESPPSSSAKAPRPQMRAKDLAAELDSINAQIHKIMARVEKAVARLAAGW
jgi:hypothetical protein